MQLFTDALHRSLEENTIYGKFLITENPDSESPDFEVSVSLMNRFMLRADLYFITTLMEHSDIFRDFSETEIPSFSAEDREIYAGYHPYFYEFHARSTDTRLRAIMREYAGQWLLMHFDDTPPEDEEISLAGTMSFSASPLISKGKTLKFNPASFFDSTCHTLNTLYSKKNVNLYTGKCVNDSSTFTKFKSILPTDIRCVEGTVYSVGLANNISLTLGDPGHRSVTLLYDIGCTHVKSVRERPDVEDNLDHFKYKRVDAVILSHWDSDHILGVGYYNPDNLYSKDIVWIAPDLNLLSEQELSAGAARLACYVAHKSNLYLANQLDSKLDTHNKVLELWQGKGKKSGQATHNNNIGLLIELNGFGFTDGMSHRYYWKRRYFPRPFFHKVHALLTGDCVFDNIPDTLKSTRYDLLVTPHHGTDLSIPDINGIDDSTAIICADESGTAVSYPGSKHVMGLLQHNFTNILITQYQGNIYFRIFT